MTSESKAKRAAVAIGSLEVDVFMLPDGSYRMSQAQASETIDEPPVYALRFLRSNDSKALLGEDYTDYKPDSIEVENASNTRGQTRINALPLDVVTAYWLTRAYKGNKKAFVLIWALLTESLERRCDHVFGIERSESDRNQLLESRLRNLERDLEKLGEGFALEDLVHQERDHFYQLLLQQGIDPYALPEHGDDRLS
jgi:hypothetical protein